MRKAPSELLISLLGPPRTARSVARSGSHLLFEILNLHGKLVPCLVGVDGIWFGHAADDRFHELARKVDSLVLIFLMCLRYSFIQCFPFQYSDVSDSRQYLNYEMKSHCVT